LWPRSLVGRLVLWAALLFAVSLPLFWALFSAAVQQVSRDVVDTRLLEFGNQLRGYWASAAAANDAAPLSEEAGGAADPFAGADIEWMWQISVNGAVAHRSQLLSLTGATLTPSASTPQAAFALRTAVTPAGELRLAERLVEEVPPFQSGNGTPAATVRVHYMAGLAINRYRALVEAHAARLRGLALLGVIPVSLSLIGMLAFIIIAIRRSLARVEGAMHAYEQGHTGHIEGRFPRELQALVDRMNNLLRQNMKLVERTRKYVTKIAHDINHPLAIMKNGLAGEVDKGLLGRQVERMVGLVERYSSLARAIGPEGQLAARTDVAALLADTAESFAILYRRTPVAISHECQQGLSFAVPRHDLEAMVSNLVSNAHKYCQGRVHLSAKLESDGALVVTVDDDGPGIPEEQRAAALNWGKRLDEAPPGTGFGLSIVRDIADLYEGEMRLTDSPFGGLRAEIRLPGRRA
jgi:signal transduction histidine kinase